MDGIRDHAIVLGASMAGVLVARALADRYERVTLVERDRLPHPGEHRRGVPQGRHVHALLTRGARVIEELFPGVTEELVAQGAVLGVASRDMTVSLSGTRLRKTDAGLEMLSVSRPLLEGHLQARLLALANVSVLEGCDVHGLTANVDRTRVTGVRVLQRVDDSAEEILDADLVVDATGRGSRSPEWLESLGYPAPREENIAIRLAYTTCEYPRRVEDRDAQIIVGTNPPGRRGGGAIAVEGDRWVVTLAGMLGDHAPTDRQGFVEYASTLPIPEIHELIRDREPLTEPVLMRYPSSRRRRYDELARFPDGFLVAGDALCNFNPIYGQGMSVAAVEAEALATCLDAGEERIGPRFFETTRPTIELAWEMAAGGDAAYDEVEVPRPAQARLIDRYLQRLTHVAGQDPEVAAAFMRVIALVAHPRTLLQPGIAWRVLVGSRHNGRATSRPDRTPERTGASISRGR